MTWLQMMTLAVIQAATEFLPVSSSGHLLFLKGIWGLEEIPLIFDIMLHVGSLLAIVIFYGRRLGQTLADACSEIRQKNKKKPAVRFIVYGIAATLVTFIVYLLFDAPIEAMAQTPAVLKWTFGITTLILLVTRFAGSSAETLVSRPPWAAAVIGLFQGLAIIPGISRSGSTVSASLMLRVRKDEAAYFSFMLAIPAILGALIFKLTDVEQLTYFLEHKAAMIVSLLISFVFSYLFLKLLVWVIQKGRFWLFAVYTGSMAVLSAVLF